MNTAQYNKLKTVSPIKLRQALGDYRKQTFMNDYITNFMVHKTPAKGEVLQLGSMLNQSSTKQYTVGANENSNSFPKSIINTSNNTITIKKPKQI